MKNLISIAFVLIALLGGADFSHGQWNACRVSLLNGSELSGSVDSIRDATLTGNLKSLDGSETYTTLPLGDVLAIAPAGKAINGDADQQGPQIYPVWGGRIGVSGLTFSGDTVKCRSSWGALSFNIQALRALAWSSNQEVQAKLKSASPENDRILVESDGLKTLEGILEGLDASQLTVNYKSKSRKIGLEKVRAVVMADLGQGGPTGALATIRTEVDVIQGLIQSVTDQTLTVQIGKSAVFSLPVVEVVHISIRSDRLQYLSDLEPIKVEEESTFTVARPWQRDLSIDGAPLSIRESQQKTALRFRKGLGTKAYTKIEFTRPAGFDRFMATVGIDAETQGNGDCRMSVQGDGIELWAQRVRGQDGPLEVELEIEGLVNIALIVEPGEQFDLADHADWCEARFLKTK